MAETRIVSGNFCNGDSQDLFIGNRNLNDVIRRDTQELAEIGGSFDAIAGRMTQLIEKSEFYCEKMREKRDAVYGKYGYEPHAERIPFEVRSKIGQEIDAMKWFPAILPDEDKVILKYLVRTRGFQLCPFRMKCNETSSSDYLIKNIKTNRELCINQMTAHLAKAHHLLEKDNKYGISAKEFYKEFM